MAQHPLGKGSRGTHSGSGSKAKWWLGRMPGKRNDKRDVVGYVGEAGLMTESELPWVTGTIVTMERKGRKGDGCAWRLRETQTSFPVTVRPAQCRMLNSH